MKNKWFRVTLLLGWILLGTGCGIGFMMDVPVKVTSWQGFRGRVVDAETGQSVPQVRVVVRAATAPAPAQPYYVFSGKDGGFQVARCTLQTEAAPLQLGERYILLFSAPTHRIRQYPVLFQGGTQELGTIELTADILAGRMRPIIPGKLQLEGERDPDTLRRVGPPLP